MKKALLNILVLTSFIGIPQGQAASCRVVFAGEQTSSIQQEWFLTPLQELRKVFKPGAEIEDILTTIEKTDLRGFTFKLEGLMRLYKDLNGEPFKEWRVRIKGLEDHMGKYTEQLEYVEFFEKHATLFPPVQQKIIRAELQRRVENEKAVLIQHLKNEKWWTQKANEKSRFDELEEMLQSQEWRSLNEDSELLIKRIRKELKEIIKGENLELLSDISKDLKNDKVQLTERAHELRRNVRWILIYIQSMRGFFKLENRSGAEYARFDDLLNSPLAESPFSKLPNNPRIKTPYTISNQYFLGLSKLVKDLSQIKAWGESVDAIAEAFVTAKIARNFDDGRNMAMNSLRSSNDRVRIYNETQTLIEDLLDSRLLEGVKDELKND